MPRTEGVARMLRADLAVAGVPYYDDAGRVVDFHALRTTFTTMLIRCGVDIRTAKELMRHATIAMTADVYACTVRGSLADAVTRLLVWADDRSAARATGTTGAAGNDRPPKKLCAKAFFHRRKRAPPCARHA